MNIYHFKPEESVHLWEVDGQIVAMVNPDSRGEVFFQVHPDYHSEELLCEMLDVAEAGLPIQNENGRRELVALANEQDAVHKDVLSRRGYRRSKFNAEHMRSRFLTQGRSLNPFPRPGTPSAPWVRRVS